MRIRTIAVVLIALLHVSMAAADDPILYVDPTAQPPVVELTPYTRPVFTAVVPARNLLPASPDPNFVLSSPFDRVPQLGDAYAIETYGVVNGATTSRIGGNVALSAPVDTGAFEKDNYGPLAVALDGSDDARRRGRFGLEAAAAKAHLAWDVQQRVEPAGVQIQAFTRLDFLSSTVEDGGVSDGEVVVRDLYFQVTPVEDQGWSVRGGKMQSYASHIAALPQTLISNGIQQKDGKNTVNIRGPVVGALTLNTNSFAIERAFPNGTAIGVGIENPGDDFELLAMEDVQLSRYPTVIGRLRYDPSVYDTFQLAAFSRFFGRENMALAEDWVAGWGVAGVAKTLLNERNVLYVGGMGGEGVGDYVSGLQFGAGPGNTQLETLEAYGGYVGLAHLWQADEQGKGRIWSNIATGYAYQGDSAMLSEDVMRRARQAMANIIFKFNKNLAFGFEYQYLDRLVNIGNSGDNHRFQLTVYVGTSGDESGTGGAAMGYSELSGDSPDALYLRDL